MKELQNDISVIGVGSNAMKRININEVSQAFFKVAVLVVCLSIISCEKNFDIDIKTNSPQLVVEAYINNEISSYNYVVLSRSLDYFSTSFQSTGVSGASVSITEGERVNDIYNWNMASKVDLAEANFPGIPANFKTGVYVDPKLATDSINSLKGKVGKSYLLQIIDAGNQYSAITTLLSPVTIDSLTTGYAFNDEDDGNKRKLRVSIHYQDPDTLNNTQLYYLRYSENRNEFGWGSLYRGRTIGTDDVTNGQYIHLTPGRGYLVGDTVNYKMASVTRDVYNFWQSFNAARNNNGPFATPVTLRSNINGANVTGCFTGLSVSSKAIIIR